MHSFVFIVAWKWVSGIAGEHSVASVIVDNTFSPLPLLASVVCRSWQFASLPCRSLRCLERIPDSWESPEKDNSSPLVVLVQVVMQSKCTQPLGLPTGRVFSVRKWGSPCCSVCAFAFPAKSHLTSPSLWSLFFLFKKCPLSLATISTFWKCGFVSFKSPV